MKALLVGLVAVIGCGGSSRTTRPTRVDHARTPVNARLADATYRDAYGYTAVFASTKYAVPTYAQAFAQTCKTSDDCGTGEFSCRAREDGVRVCMGYGSSGESCWFDADCVSGTCAADDNGHKICR